MRGLQSDVFKINRILIIKLSFVIFFAIISVLLYTRSAFADQFSWIGDSQPEVTYSAKASNPPAPCTTTEKTIIGFNDTRNVCIQSSGSFKFATFNYTGSIYKGAVSFGADRNMYMISDGMCGGYYNDCQYIPDKDIMISRYYYLDSNFKTGFALFKNFSKKLVQTKNPLGQVTGYTFPLSTAQPDFILKKDTEVKSYQVSDDGDWIVAEIRDRGIIRINTDDFTVKKFTNQYHQYNVGINPGMEFSITKDGSWVAVSGSNVDPNIYRVDESCGIGIDSDDDMSERNYTVCPSKYMTNMIGDRANGLKFISAPKFSEDGGELQLFLGYYDYTKNEIINLLAPGYVAPRLDYLALGDSYSSGEGDTEKDTATNQKYYRGWTDNEENISQNQPREKCHISTRSYPYILAQGMGLRGTNKWNTVACSGAHSWDINALNSNVYKGQGKGGQEGGKPRLEGYSNWSELKTRAINEFIPGRQKQIEFVKKYKPKAITLTMGGNDIGFGDKITACAGITSPGTCDIAAESGKSGLANEIRDQYDNLKDLYTKLYDASGRQSKIYVLGYPQFINGAQNASCSGGSIFQLNSEERNMIENSITYFNNVVEQAANASGVKYINTESSLGGHRLCDSGKKYVTGITNIIGLNGNEQQESFHPNANGNFEIAMTVWDKVNNESLINHDICINSDRNACPDTNATKDTINVPTYFQSTTSNNVKYSKLTNGTITKGQPVTLSSDNFILQPGSIATKTLHSEPLDLGESVVNDDGSLSDGTMIIPNTVIAGYHTLVISGKTYSGESIQLEQTILIQGSNPVDIDDNGTLDSQQPCGPFIATTGMDIDFDGVDDACDPFIDEAQPYRIRNGNTSKGENAEYMYIERNVHATSITGISGDYDKDNDGWAIVAQSTKPANSGTPAHFWIDDNKVPHVSIRTNNKGCVQLTPRSLKVVKLNKIRKFKQEATNTNTCRSEPASADVDNNGVTDNQQPIYRARNGNIANGEDPSSIYLERNSIASEAQLGLSDYSHSNQWNLLASSQNNATKANFVKIVMVTDEKNKPSPVLLAKKPTTNKKGVTTFTCIALEPSNTNVIKQTTQDDRKLKKVNIPQGGNCE